MYAFVFFFKQKTAYEMRISDWSSDVCSSDLHIGLDALRQSDPALRPAKIHGACAAQGTEAGEHFHRDGTCHGTVFGGPRPEVPIGKKLRGIFDEDRKSTRLNSSH